MPQASPYLLLLSTCPTAEVAEDIAQALVESRLAACSNIVPGIRSVYRWQGQVEKAQEYLLLIKTHRDRYPALEAAIRARHPYSLPEIIALPIATGLADYLAWIGECVAQHS
jgi:periplasmic divalent cation tolerance protein